MGIYGDEHIIHTWMNRKAAQRLADAWATGEPDSEIVAAVRDCFGGQDGHLVRLEAGLSLDKSERSGWTL